MNAEILIVEDDLYLREGLCELLTSEGCKTDAASSCAQAREYLKSSYDLVILDVMLPDGSGVELCSSLRSSGNAVPVLFLTACDDELQIVRGLDAGGDDYVTKPFRLRELLSRIRALLRRSSFEPLSFANGDISLDSGNMTVKKGGETVLLTPTEFQLLSVLMRNSGVIVSRSRLLQSIWDCDGSFIDDNTLSVHMSRLREKIGAEHISTVRGVGYRWEEGK